jgi:hypothetical protein
MTRSDTFQPRRQLGPAYFLGRPAERYRAAFRPPAKEMTGAGTRTSG